MALLKLRSARAILLLMAFAAHAGGEKARMNTWQGTCKFSQNLLGSVTWVQPAICLAFDLDHSALINDLATAPNDTSDTAVDSGSNILLPLPNGVFSMFRFVESPVMAPELASQFPEIRTFVGQGVDDATLTVRFD